MTDRERALALAALEQGITTNASRPVEVLAAYRLVTARKEYRCMLCSQPIPAGTQYIYERLGPHVSSDHDYWWTYRAHPECDRILTEVLPELGGECEVPLSPSKWQEILELHAELPRIRAERAEREQQYRALQEQLRQERERRQMGHA